MSNTNSTVLVWFKSNLSINKFPVDHISQQPELELEEELLLLLEEEELDTALLFLPLEDDALVPWVFGLLDCLKDFRCLRPDFNLCLFSLSMSSNFLSISFRAAIFSMTVSLALLVFPPLEEGLKEFWNCLFSAIFGDPSDGVLYRNLLVAKLLQDSSPLSALLKTLSLEWAFVRVLGDGDLLWMTLSLMRWTTKGLSSSTLIKGLLSQL